MQVEAAYYDGRSACRHQVLLGIGDGWLELSGEAERREALSEVSIPAALGNTPRLILFRDGARCEIADQEGFSALLAVVGQGPSLLARLESRWMHALAALFLTMVAVVAAYLWGLPVLAQQVAAGVPAPVMHAMDSQFLLAVDGRLLHPSKLPEGRQQAIVKKFAALRRPAPGLLLRVMLRSSPEIGPNAFALPGGTVILLDELVNIAGSDEEILAVLAHEAGHVSERHALRQMLQASVVGLAMMWYVGDVSTLLATAPAAALEMRYSRDFERSADAYAARMLALNRIPPARLAQVLERMERVLGVERFHRSEVLDYFSTHPPTQERMRTLEGQP